MADDWTPYSTGPVPWYMVQHLVSWPQGTVGHNDESALIAQLVRICSRHGYGRVPEIVKAIEEIWREGDAAIPEQAAQAAGHAQKMADLTRSLAKYRDKDGEYAKAAELRGTADRWEALQRLQERCGREAQERYDALVEEHKAREAAEA